MGAKACIFTKKVGDEEAVGKDQYVILMFFLKCIFGSSHNVRNISSVAIPNQLLRQTIYYVTWVPSCLYNESKLDIEIAPLLVIFIAKQTLTSHQAQELKLPFELVASRTRGGLLYPSSDMFALILEIEHAFSSLLSTQNLIAFGGSLMTAVLDVVMKSVAISSALHQYMIPVYETTQRESACCQPEPSYYWSALLINIFA